MNKRQVKKQNKKLYNAIVELNLQASEDLEMDNFILDYSEIDAIYERIKKNPRAVARTLRDYKKFVK